MVLEMKKDLQITLEELAKIQDKEEAEINHSKELQYQQQQQLEYLTETIREVKVWIFHYIDGEVSHIPTSVSFRFSW